MSGQPQADIGSRRRRPVTSDELAVAGHGVDAEDLLLEDGRHERLDHRAGAGQAQPGVPAVEVSDDVGPGGVHPGQEGGEPVHVVVEAEEVRHLFDGPRRTVTPGPGADPAGDVVDGHVQGRRPEGRVGRPPQLGGAARARRITPAPHQATDRRPQVEGDGEGPLVPQLRARRGGGDGSQCHPPTFPHRRSRPTVAADVARPMAPTCLP